VFRSLRFRLPALFLAAIVLAGLVSTAVAVSVSKRYAQNTLRKQAFRELTQEARGIDQIYREHAGGNAPPSSEIERASGDQVFYMRPAKGIDVFPGPTPAYTLLPRRLIDFSRILAGQTVRFEFTPPGRNTRLLAVARPVKLGGKVFGAVILARRKTLLNQSWLPLIWRLFPAFFAGILVAGALGWYLSRRITTPVLALSDASDEVAAGRYDVVVPQVPGGGEISHLASRFREMASQLQEAEALERNFLMTVSHELRTPLTAIRGHVEALLEGVVEDEEAKLDMHRFALRREEVDMERLIDRAYSAFGEEARRRGIDYRRSIAAKPILETDGDRVLQVISNLLSNAFRWTPDGGRVGLALKQADGTIRVAVDDSGPGIPREEQERIFRPFWSRDGHGTGLGLAIASELAAALGGEIELRTEAGKGSRFELVLPAMKSD